MLTNTQIKNKELIYPELSYQILGAAFNVFNSLGWGHKELFYQRALSSKFDSLGIKYQKEINFPVEYNNKIIAQYRIDFVIENKVVIELKIKPKIGYVHLKQVLEYLKQSGLKLGIIIYFTKEGVKYKRLVY
jgi:GxxExxY protein